MVGESLGFRSSAGTGPDGRFGLPILGSRRTFAFRGGYRGGKKFGLLGSGDFVCQGERKRPCVVATNTISLQEQLLGKDIPALRKLLKEIPNLSQWADFKCALLVGRANYLCSTRLRKTMAGQSELFEGGQRDELQRIAQWSDTEAREGIRQELSPSPWEPSGMR